MAARHTLGYCPKKGLIPSAQRVRGALCPYCDRPLPARGDPFEVPEDEVATGRSRYRLNASVNLGAAEKGWQMAVGHDSGSPTGLGFVYPRVKRVEAVAPNGNTLAWIEHRASVVVFPDGERWDIWSDLPGKLLEGWDNRRGRPARAPRRIVRVEGQLGLIAQLHIDPAGNRIEAGGTTWPVQVRGGQHWSLGPGCVEIQRTGRKERVGSYANIERAGRRRFLSVQMPERRADWSLTRNSPLPFAAVLACWHAMIGDLDINWSGPKYERRTFG